MKATGNGLLHPLTAFDVSAAPGKSLELLRTAGDAKDASRWTIRDVRPAEEFAGAFALEGESREAQYWQWAS